MFPLLILGIVLVVAAASGARAREAELEAPPYVPPPMPREGTFVVDPNPLEPTRLVPIGPEPLAPTILVPGPIRRDPGWLG